jgi:Uma2 family endonuclease
VTEESPMQSAAQRVRMTYRDLLKLPDDGLRHELIDGVHFVTPSPVSRHQLVLGNLHRIIGPHVHARQCGVALFAPYDIVFSQYDVVEPDLVYFSMDRYREVVTEKNAQGPPNLAVEILSPTTRSRDEVLKRRLYERTGVDEYWIVDTKQERVAIYRMKDRQYARTDVAREEAAGLSTPLLPDLVISLGDLFDTPPHGRR